MSTVYVKPEQYVDTGPKTTSTILGYELENNVLIGIGVCFVLLLACMAFVIMYNLGSE